MMEAPTSPMMRHRKASSGKGSRWMSALTSGKTPYAQQTQPATHAKTERKSGWFSEMPFMKGRPL